MALNKKIDFWRIKNFFKQHEGDLVFFVSGIVFLIIAISIFVYSLGFIIESLREALVVSSGNTDMVRFNIKDFESLGIKNDEDNQDKDNKGRSAESGESMNAESEGGINTEQVIDDQGVGATSADVQ